MSNLDAPAALPFSGWVHRFLIQVEKPPGLHHPQLKTGEIQLMSGLA
jgi:hypothetical protein